MLSSLLCLLVGEYSFVIPVLFRDFHLFVGAAVLIVVVFKRYHAIFFEEHGVLSLGQRKRKVILGS